MRIDPHSYTENSQPIVTYLEWKAHVDFARRVIRATATLSFAAPGTGLLELDTKGLTIEAVEGADGQALPHELSPPEPILGQKLAIRLPPGTAAVRIRYETAPGASALQWLSPEQTAGRRFPFLFTQCQPIHARALVPLQDTPGHRLRFRAELNVPREMRGLVAAGFVGRKEERDRAVEVYEMPQPIPSYLFAFAVGELVSRELGPRSRAWAEPSLATATAHEFAEVDHMLTAAEALFGPYDWDRFDFLVLPPSFPYGGMENPRLTFLTPTLLAGDRSLVDVLAHELAHSWAGNLVTNATVEHFWLNEGLTMYAERRILEALHGPDVAAISAANGWKSLEEAIRDFADKPQLTCLRTHLQGIDPDEAFSVVPYEKGYLLFRALEEAVGRRRFDGFLREYLAHFRFKSLTTEEFATFVAGALPGALERIGAPAYFETPGIPAQAVRARSERLEAIARLGRELPSEAVAGAWLASEWQLWLSQLLGNVTREHCGEIDRRFHLTGSGNCDVLAKWLEVAIGAGYAPAMDRAERMLGEVGRMKYLKPIYRSFVRQDPGRARAIFGRHRSGYHPIAVQAVETVFK